MISRVKRARSVQSNSGGGDPKSGNGLYHVDEEEGSTNTTAEAANVTPAQLGNVGVLRTAIPTPQLCREGIGNPTEPALAVTLHICNGSDHSSPARISSNRLIGHHYASRRIAVPKIFGMHEIELRPGVKPEEYEQFYTKELASLPEFEGWKTHLLKGDRGERAGKFLLLFEIESEEARDRYFPIPEEESEEVRRFLEQHPQAAAAWEKESTFLIDPYPRTDYIVVAEHQLQSGNTEP